MSLHILQIPAGRMNNFSYLVFDRNNRHGIGVDPSLAPEQLLAAIAEHQVTLDLLVNTHGHNDHTAGNGAVLAATGASLAAHPADLPEAEVPLVEGTTLPLGDATLTVWHSPGHTPGSIVLHCPGAIITGDTLFVTRVGRADLPGSDPAALYRSLRRLATLDGTTLVYPGHDYGPQPHSTIAYENSHNPFLQCPDLAGFLRLRMG